DTDIALKIAAAYDPGELGFAARVRREARIGYLLGRLPGIVRCLDWGTAAGGAPGDDAAAGEGDIDDLATVGIPGRASPRKRAIDDSTLFMALDLVEGATTLDVTNGPREQRLHRLVAAAARVGL